MWHRLLHRARALEPVLMLLMLTYPADVKSFLLQCTQEYAAVTLQTHETALARTRPPFVEACCQTHGKRSHQRMCRHDENKSEAYHSINEGEGHNGFVASPVPICQPGTNEGCHVACSREQACLNARTPHRQLHNICQIDGEVGSNSIVRQALAELVTCVDKASSKLTHRQDDNQGQHRSIHAKNRCSLQLERRAVACQ